MATICEELRAARLARDLTFEDLTEVTKIRPFFLQCLEEGRYDKLPGAFCVVSFQRQYALAVGIDEAMAVEALRGAEVNSLSGGLPDGPVTPAVPPGYFLGRAISMLADEGRKNLGAFTTVCVAATLIVAGSYLWHSLDRSGEEPIVLHEATAPVAIPREADAEATLGGQSVSGMPSSNQSAAPDQKSEMMEIEIRAADRLWIRYLVDEVNEREMTLVAGERRLIRADSVLQVSIGNAAVTTLVFDGKVHDKIGASGQVRHMRITREGWSFVPPGSF